MLDLPERHIEQLVVGWAGAVHARRTVLRQRIDRSRDHPGDWSAPGRIGGVLATAGAMTTTSIRSVLREACSHTGLDASDAVPLHQHAATLYLIRSPMRCRSPEPQWPRPPTCTSCGKIHPWQTRQDRRSSPPSGRGSTYYKGFIEGGRGGFV